MAPNPQLRVEWRRVAGRRHFEGAESGPFFVKSARETANPNTFKRRLGARCLDLPRVPRTYENGQCASEDGTSSPRQDPPLAEACYNSSMNFSPEPVVKLENS